MSSRLKSLFLMTFLFPLILPATLLAAGQTLTLRLINGESGKPMTNFNVTLNWANSLKSTVVFIGPDGKGHVDVIKGATTFTMMPGPKIGKDPNRIAYLDCNRHSAKGISVQEVSEKGSFPKILVVQRTQSQLQAKLYIGGYPATGGRSTFSDRGKPASAFFPLIVDCRTQSPIIELT